MNHEISLPTSIRDVCAVLQPLFDLGDVRDLNAATAYRLAQLIHPRDASDLTVGDIRILLSRIAIEQRAAMARQETSP